MGIKNLLSKKQTENSISPNDYDLANVAMGRLRSEISFLRKINKMQKQENGLLKTDNNNLEKQQKRKDDMLTVVHEFFNVPRFKTPLSLKKRMHSSKDMVAFQNKEVFIDNLRKENAELKQLFIDMTFCANHPDQTIIMFEELIRDFTKIVGDDPEFIEQTESES